MIQKDLALEAFMSDGYKTREEISMFLNLTIRQTTQYMTEQKQHVPYAYGAKGYYIPKTLKGCNDCYKIMRSQAIQLMVSARTFKRTAETYYGEDLKEHEIKTI